ncbi:ATP-binding protein [Enterococcus sp.]|uniref:AAA family ATPase n=1 Tax=Enterococcus sp. TaxID=35783 RepID=UPI002913312D|nr:ATP-binding protein [Enterococcus sp.]MDU5334411.1 ATP-binding protein [Enterococcus sp.]
MLIQFKVKNFLSFKDEQVFSMVSSNKLSELPENRIEVVKDDFYLLKSASIFGANSSGKSNLLAAIGFMKRFIMNSLKESQNEGNIAELSFALNAQTRHENTILELSFLLDDTIIRYGFSIDRKSIQEEWLYMDEALVFFRENQELSQYDHDRLEPQETEIKFNMTNSKSLFLTILATTNTDFAEWIVDYIRNDVNIIHGLGGGRVDFTKIALKKGNKLLKKKILEMLEIADLNINNLEVVKAGDVDFTDTPMEDFPEELLSQIELDINRLISEHNVYDNEGNIVGKHKFDAEIYESSGTNEFIKIAGPLIDTLENDKVLFIDEIDAKLHPLMTKYILSLFNSKKNSRAQLIMTSHNATVLGDNLLRRDQIWFTEKDSFEASHLTALSNYKFKGEVVRKDEKYDKNYLKGKYGAIPIIKSHIIDEVFSSDSEVL